MIWDEGEGIILDFLDLGFEFCCCVLVGRERGCFFFSILLNRLMSIILSKFKYYFIFYLLYYILLSEVRIIFFRFRCL